MNRERERESGGDERKVSSAAQADSVVSDVGCWRGSAATAAAAANSPPPPLYADDLARLHPINLGRSAFIHGSLPTARSLSRRATDSIGRSYVVSFDNRSCERSWSTTETERKDCGWTELRHGQIKERLITQ